MADVIPFKGVLYNTKNITDMSKVLAPPYDVISEEMQQKLYSSHQFNIVRLILGKIEDKDTKSNNRYTRARDYLKNWLDESVLKKDTQPSFYIYDQEYLHRGQKKTRIGFIGLMKIEDPRTSQILPHEHTFLGPKKDRLSLMKEAKSNLSPIFSLFEDENSLITNILKNIASKTQPIINVEIDGVNHKLWAMHQKDQIEKIKHFMKGKAVFIADGHHRYEVALAFKESAEKEQFKPSFNYVMAYFSNLNQEAITILSTHRVVKDIGGLTEKQLISKLQDNFEIKVVKNSKQLFINLEKTKEIQFGLYCGNNKFYSLTLKDKKVLDELACSAKSCHWKQLSVTILHQLIFSRILQIKENVEKKDNIIYTRDEYNAINLVDKCNYKATFFLKPAEVDQFKDIAESRDRMPHKSTYFYPKLLSGLVINKF